MFVCCFYVCVCVCVCAGRVRRHTRQPLISSQKVSMTGLPQVLSGSRSPTIMKFHGRTPPCVCVCVDGRTSPCVCGLSVCVLCVCVYVILPPSPPCRSVDAAGLDAGWQHRHLPGQLLPRGLAWPHPAGPAALVPGTTHTPSHTDDVTTHI